MEEFTSALNNLTILLIVIGGSVFTLCLAVGAILFMTAAGDPHKQQLAKGAMFGAVIGAVVLAMSPLAPRVLSKFVIEPSGGQALERTIGSSCDDHLRTGFITQRGVSTTLRANSMISQVQTKRRDECNPDSWDPEIAATQTCKGSTSNNRLGTEKVIIPASLIAAGGVNGEDGVTRDQDGNIMIGFKAGSLPGDTSLCWMYSANAGFWISSPTLPAAP